MGVNSAEERDIALATILYRLAGTISEHGLLPGKSVSLIDEHGNKVGHAKLSGHRFLRRFLRDDSGATATEYALLIVFVALAVATGAQTLGSSLNTFFSNIGTQLSGITLPPLP